MRWALLGPACGVAALAWVARAQSCDGEGDNWLIESYRNPLGNCSGAGVCAAGECECMPGYTGLSDVVNMQGLDCQIFEPAIMALWVVNLLVTSVVLAIAAPQLKARWRQHQANVATGRRVSMRQNKGLVSVAIFVLWVAPSLCLMALVRLADSSQRIGVTWAITVLFVWLRIGFYTVVYNFQTGLIGSLLNAGKNPRMQRLLVLVTNGQLACSVIAIVVSSAPLVLLLARDDEIIGPTPAALATWYCITLGFALQLLFVFAFALYIKRKIKRAFDVSYQMNESEHILAMRNALLGVQNSAVVQSGVQCLIYLALGLFPFFYTKHDYWMPVGTLAYPIIGYKLAKTAINTGTGSSNNASGKSKESNQSSLAAHPSSKSDDKSFNFDSVKPPSSFGLGGSIAPQQGGGHGKRHSKASASERFEKNKSHYQEDRGGDEDEHSGDEYV